MRRRMLILMLPALLALPAWQSTGAFWADIDMSEAIRAYRAQEYAEASQAFATLLGSEPDATRRAVLHTNAGTAAARAGESLRGDAIWHLMMARRLDPSNAVARINLSRVKALADTGDSEARQLSSALAALPLELTPGQTRHLSALLLGLGLLLAAWWRSRQASPGSLRASGQSVLGWAAVLLLLLPPAGVWWSLQAREMASQDAVVLGVVVPLRSEPQAEGEILFRLAAGTVVRADDLRPGWRLVETALGARGWVAEGQLRLVDAWALIAKES